MTPEQEQLVLTLVEHVIPLLHRYAASAHLDYDDLRQDASLLIMSIVARRPATCSPVYVWVSVKNQLLRKIAYTHLRRMVSLDAPITTNQDTLADLLPSPYSVDPLALLLTRERIEGLLSQPRRKYYNPRVLRELADTALASLP